MYTRGTKKGCIMVKTAVARIVNGEGKLQEFSTRDELLLVLNQEPPREFVKDHPLAKGVKYMPIDKVELMLTNIFQTWYVEILREGQLLNALYCAIRLHYKDPISGEMLFQDGVGAVAIQVDSGKNASDLGAIKSNAVMLGLPASKSYATKDAAENIGKIFGSDLNRKDTMAFSPSYADNEDVEGKIEQATSIEELQMIIDNLSPSEKVSAQPIIEKKMSEL